MSKKAMQLDSAVEYRLPRLSKRVIYLDADSVTYTFMKVIKGEHLTALLKTTTPRGVCLFIYLAHVCPWNSPVAHCSIDQIAEGVSVPISTVYDTIAVLKKKGFVRQVGVGRYWLDSHIVWCGTEPERQKACEKWLSNT